jgi:SAM-dependent methyltransferase
MNTEHNTHIKSQFDLRSSSFERSVFWVTDPALIAAHTRLAGKPTGKSLELCCGTGAVSRGLKAAGWDVMGVDISEGMVKEASKYIPAQVADVAKLPFADHSFDLVVMRQAYFLLDDGPATLKEVARVLKPGGKFILSHLVPFSEIDSEHLKLVHTTKQAQMRKFYTSENLRQELESANFSVVAQDSVVVRESVSLWMQEAPELSEDTRRAVCDLVVRAPAEYRQLRRVEVVNGEIMEDWNFVLLLASPKGLT